MIKLEWVVECCSCRKVERFPAQTLDLVCDSDPVPVRAPDPPGWETDGIGGWMCAACYRKHEGSL